MASGYRRDGFELRDQKASSLRASRSEGSRKLLRGMRSEANPSDCMQKSRPIET